MMNPVSSRPPAHVPVLTDVIEDAPARTEQAGSPALVTAPVPAPAPVALPEINETQLAQRVLADVQKQVDGMLDFRLREAIAPVLARHSEALVRELREELSRTLGDVVHRAVSQELAKIRHR